MKAFVCMVLLAAAALAAPEGKRDKRGFLHGGYSGGYSSGLALGHGFGYDDIHLDHGIVEHAPAHIVSVNKIVEVPKIVEVKKIVSVPRVVKVSRVVAAPHVHVSYSHAPLSGWW
ncbi:uncharacterized protein [Epargyreus clarus]|uniref:uncharacterized protein n=1 Tax=Epargyreus clarus TaxID=520877 RepID=UPI003C2DD736